MPLGTDVGLSPGDFVLHGDPVPLPKRGRSLPPKKFFGQFYCGQTAGWMKMPLGTKVGLSPGDSVLDGDHLDVFIHPAKWLDGLRRRLVRK